MNAQAFMPAPEQYWHASQGHQQVGQHYVPAKLSSRSTSHNVLYVEATAAPVGLILSQKVTHCNAKHPALLHRIQVSHTPLSVQPQN